MPHEALIETDHRPWPIPTAPWLIAQSWRQLLFAHWRVDAKSLRPFIPDALEIEEADGSAWVAVVPFFMCIRPRGVPEIPRVFTFPEINVRTYVSYEGKPGVWFLSLDARHLLAVWFARAAFNLPYFHARMRMGRTGTEIHYSSARRGTTLGRFEGRYRPTSEAYCAAKDTLDYFLTERYCLYAQDARGGVSRTEVHHAPWPLQVAEAEIETDSMAEASGLPLEGPPELLHYADRIEVVTWAPERLSR